MNNKCPYCNKIFSRNHSFCLDIYSKCEDCNVLFENKFDENFINTTSLYILSKSLLIKPSNRFYMITIIDDMISNDGLYPEFILHKINSSYELFKISFGAVIDYSNMTINPKLLSDITPNNFDKKLKTILTFM